MVAHQALGIPVQLVWAIGVHAPDEHGIVTARAHGMGKGGNVRMQCVRVGPHLVFKGITPREHGHARGHADRRRAIAVFKHHASCREPVEMGRRDDPVPIASRDVRIVLVRVDVEQVGF